MSTSEPNQPPEPPPAPVNLPDAHRGRSRLPLWLKVVYTAFLAVLIPYYLQAYGPTNFLYFCDVALLMAFIALWTESPLWASMPAVGILLPQSLWCADFLAGLVGRHLTGMSAYMFNPGLSLFTRGLSSFHFWLPFLVVFIVWRVGYDRRAFAAWTGLALSLMLVCYFLMPAPPPPPDNPNLPVNINYVYGPSDDQPQHWMPPLAYLALLMCTLPLAIYLPTHLLLSKLFGEPERAG
jgi:hypothetical protein